VCVCVCESVSVRERHEPLVQDLQLEALGLHHPPEAPVVAVDGQREALVVFWGRRSTAAPHETRASGRAASQPASQPASQLSYTWE